MTLPDPPLTFQETVELLMREGGFLFGSAVQQARAEFGLPPVKFGKARTGDRTSAKRDWWEKRSA